MARPKTIESDAPEATLALGRALGAALRPGDMLALTGDLGAGKTWLVKGVAEGLGIPAREVTSPTFVLMHVYEGRIPLAHFDAYRLSGGEEMLDFGAEEAFYGQGASAVEWAERVEDVLPEDRLEVCMSVVGQHSRRLEFRPTGPRAAELLKALTQSRAACGASGPRGTGPRPARSETQEP